MEFLVHIDVSLPADMPDARRAELVAAERRRGRELLAQGAIRRIWRLPGTTANVGVWAARDATELHELIGSLPLFPWLRAEVTALAQHPLEAQE